jgi:uncharacterized SAM-binding protein YcdF (DUF218 family)
VFTLSKALDVLTEPLAFLCALLLFGLLLRSYAARLSTIVLWSALSLLLMLGFEAIPNRAMRHLELSYSRATADLSGYAGMVILGGVFTNGDWIGVRDLAVNHAAERAIVPVALLRKFPRLKIVFSGGDGDHITRIPRPEADRARAFFDAMGVSRDTVLYERESRTTAENAALSARLAGVDVSAPWLLVTSAWHMPRSLAAFHKAGWKDVTALPVDFRSSADMPMLSYSFDRSLALWRIVLHEYAGLVWYRVNGIA